MINKKIAIFVGLVLLLSAFIPVALKQATQNSGNSIIKANFKDSYLAAKCGKYSGVSRGDLGKCVKETIDQRVLTEGFAATAKDLEASVKIVPEINLICHPFAHYIGRGAFQELKSVRLALTAHTSFCVWGYLHGLNIEASTQYKGQELLDILLDGCYYLKSLKGNYFECAHGIGDAFQSISPTLQEAVSWCDKIPEEGVSQNCSQGAANYWADDIVKRSKADGFKATEEEKALLGGDPYMLCRTFKVVNSRAGCFNYAVRLNQAYLGGITSFPDFCAKENSVDQSDCYRGVGREIAYSQGYSIDQSLDQCSKAGTLNAVAACTEEVTNSRTQMFQDIDGVVLKSVCAYAIKSKNPGVLKGCEQSKINLSPYYSGDFNL